MRQHLLIAAAFAVTVWWPLSNVALAQTELAQPELAQVLSNLDEGARIRFHIAGTEKPQEWRFRRLAGDSLILKVGRDLSRTYAGDLDSLWVREGVKSGGVGFLVGGGIGATLGGLIGYTIYQSMFSSDFWQHKSGPGRATLAGAAVGFLLGGLVGAIATHDKGEWQQRYPLKSSGDQPQSINHNQTSGSLRLGIVPDPKTGLRLAASYAL